MKSNDDTKKFSRLCNELIGHETKDLNNMTSMEKVDQWYDKANKLKELSVKVNKMLSNQERV